ncbi:MAG: D-hexose-6-phosphate mutarotase [Phycisphaeraceae bacterium]
MPQHTPPETSSDPIRDAAQRFSLPGLTFEAGPGGVPFAHITNAHGRASIAFLGATTLGYQPANESAVLFLSEDALFVEGQAIRGGVPICFPWFGPRADDPKAPSHGVVRTRLWDLDDAIAHNGAHTLRFSTSAPPLQATFELTLGPRLGMSLTVSHTDSAAEPVTFEEALHTYFAVADAREVTVTGLEQTDYLDKVDHGERKTQGDDPIGFAGETDRVYLNTSTPCTLHDPQLDRALVIDKDGSRSTIVWNPWIEKARRLTDLPSEDWPRFVCVESGNVAENAITLRPGEHHRLAVSIRVQRRDTA